MTAPTTHSATEGIAAAATAVLRGELVVLPTDTVYGLGADAFNPAAVSACWRPRAAAGTCRRRCWSARSGRHPPWWRTSGRTGSC